jgi:dienelactone hydrolase
MKKISLLIIMGSIMMGGCASISPDKMKSNLTYYSVGDEEIKPVVFILPGSGGRHGEQSYSWATWFSSLGIMSVMIESARVRGIKRLFGVNYGGDISPALEVASENPNIDSTRYAVIGFSRGGTAALESASYLKENQPKPDFIFSLYPGDMGLCPNSHEEPTKVFIFYGEKDGWGSYQGNRNACKSMASWHDNTTFYLLKNAKHGYDGLWAGRWSCCGGKTFENAHNKEALEKTRAVIFEALSKKWRVEKEE